MASNRTEIELKSSGVPNKREAVVGAIMLSGFNTPAGRALTFILEGNGAVDLLEPPDAFNIPVPQRN
jgi:hypothetical protein